MASVIVCGLLQASALNLALPTTTRSQLRLSQPLMHLRDQIGKGRHGGITAVVGIDAAKTKQFVRQQSSAARFAGSANSASLKDKVETLREQLSLAQGDTLASTVNKAMQELGLGQKDIIGQTLMQKANACLETLGVASDGEEEAYYDEQPRHTTYYAPSRRGTQPALGYGGSLESRGAGTHVRYNAYDNGGAYYGGGRFGGGGGGYGTSYGGSGYGTAPVGYGGSLFRGAGYGSSYGFSSGGSGFGVGYAINGDSRGFGRYGAASIYDYAGGVGGVSYAASRVRGRTSGQSWKEPRPAPTTMSLQQKIETLREQLSLTQGEAACSSLASTVNKAMQELGLEQKDVGGETLMQKANACLETLGVAVDEGAAMSQGGRHATPLRRGGAAPTARQAVAGPPYGGTFSTERYGTNYGVAFGGGGFGDNYGNSGYEVRVGGHGGNFRSQRGSAFDRARARRSAKAGGSSEAASSTTRPPPHRSFKGAP